MSAGPTPRDPVARRAVTWLLERLLASHLREAVLGDLAERGASTRDRWRELVRAPLTWLIRRDARKPPSAVHAPNRDSAMSLLLADLRYAWRSITRRKAHAALAAGTIALGIGASTAIVSVVHPVLVQTLPYPDGDRLAMLWDRGRDGRHANLGFQTFQDVERAARSFEGVAAMSYMTTSLSSGGEALFLAGQRVSAGYFDVLGVRPALGRAFEPADDLRGTPPVVIISHALWRDAFGSDPRILERPVDLNGQSVAVVGVMPEDFDNVLAPDARIWAPLRYTAELPWACRTCRHLRVVARRRADATADAALREVELIGQNLGRDFPQDYAGPGLTAVPLAEDLTRSVRPALLAVTAAVALVLLVASLNVSNLLLARGAGRRAEFAVRAALGASRTRIVRQLLTESLLLALAGGVLGVAIAMLGVKGLLALSPPALPRLAAVEVNGIVLAYAFAITTAVGIAFGLAPAWQAAGATLTESIRRGARSIAGGERRARGAIVVAEVALALVLLVGSGLLLRSMQRVLDVDPGFEPRGMLALQVQGGNGRLRDDEAIHAFYGDVLATVRALPGVADAAFVNQLPLSGDFDGNGISIEARPRATPSENPSAFRYAVSDGYLEAMRMPVLRGRAFTPQDASGPPVAIVNAGFVAKYLEGLDPIGQRIRVGGSDEEQWREIVGVVGDVRHVTLEAEATDGAYIPSTQWSFADAARWVVVRAAEGVEPLALAAPVRDAIRSIDRDQPIPRIAAIEELVVASTSQRRFALVLFQVFALVAVALAAAGIHGVLAGAVAERTRELGVRAAFGATRRDLVLLVVRQGMGLVIGGVVAGLVLAFLATRAIQGMLFGIPSIDPPTYVAVLAALLLVAVAACGVPAYRASTIDPANAMREE